MCANRIDLEVLEATKTKKFLFTIDEFDAHSKLNLCSPCYVFNLMNLNLGK